MGNDMLFGDLFEGQSQNKNQAAVGVKKDSKNAMETNPSGLNAPMQQNVIGAWLLVAAVLIGVILILQRFSTEHTFAHVKLGFYNMLVIGFYCVLFLSGAKAVAMKYRNNPVSALILAS